MKHEYYYDREYNHDDVDDADYKNNDAVAVVVVLF